MPTVTGVVSPHTSSELNSDSTKTVVSNIPDTKPRKCGKISDEVFVKNCGFCVSTIMLLLTKFFAPAECYWTGHDSEGSL